MAVSEGVCEGLLDVLGVSDPVDVWTAVSEGVCEGLLDVLGVLEELMDSDPV